MCCNRKIPITCMCRVSQQQKNGGRGSKHWRTWRGRRWPCRQRPEDQHREWTFGHSWKHDTTAKFIQHPKLLCRHQKRGALGSSTETTSTKSGGKVDAAWFLPFSNLTHLFFFFTLFSPGFLSRRQESLGDHQPWCAGATEPEGPFCSSFCCKVLFFLGPRGPLRLPLIPAPSSVRKLSSVPSFFYPPPPLLTYSCSGPF